MLILSLLFGIEAALPNPAEAAQVSSFRGRVVGPYANYGSWATIGTTQPFITFQSGCTVF